MRAHSPAKPLEVPTPTAHAPTPRAPTSRAPTYSPSSLIPHPENAAPWPKPLLSNAKKTKMGAECYQDHRPPCHHLGSVSNVSG